MTLIVPSIVIPGLVSGIHVLTRRKDVDGRNKCGHDGCDIFKAGRTL
jgi:hypothetical protein